MLHLNCIITTRPLTRLQVIRFHKQSVDVHSLVLLLGPIRPLAASCAVTGSTSQERSKRSDDYYSSKPRLRNLYQRNRLAHVTTWVPFRSLLFSIERLVVSVNMPVRLECISNSPDSLFIFAGEYVWLDALNNLASVIAECQIECPPDQSSYSQIIYLSQVPNST